MLLFPELAERPELDAILRGLIASLQGVALVAHLSNHDVERDFIMTAAASKEYGIIDQVIAKRN